MVAGEEMWEDSPPSNGRDSQQGERRAAALDAAGGIGVVWGALVWITEPGIRRLSQDDANTSFARRHVSGLSKQVDFPQSRPGTSLTLGISFQFHSSIA